MTNYMDKKNDEGYAGDPIDKGAVEPFEDMVERLFKASGFHDKHAALMHAAIGSSGEIGELALLRKVPMSMARASYVEEIGDVRFYLSALGLIASKYYNCDKEANTACLSKAKMSCMSEVELLLAMHHHASELLDLSKKSWVYGKEPEIAGIAVEAFRVMEYLGEYQARLNISTDEVMESNRIKLTGKQGRYVSGYSDESAQKRADKHEHINNAKGDWTSPTVLGKV